MSSQLALGIEEEPPQAAPTEPTPGLRRGVGAEVAVTDATPPHGHRKAYLTAGQLTSSPPKGSRGLGGARGFDREKDDFYATPVALTEALLRIETFPVDVWEPACGDGAISRILQARGHKVLSTDLVERGYGCARHDFLMEHVPGGDAVITNPPFRLWYEFAQHATSPVFSPRFEKVALLGRLQLLEGKRMSAMFRATGLTRVWVSTGRVNMLPPGAVDKGHNGMIAFAWYVWQRGSQGPPQIGWFTPERGGA